MNDPEESTLRELLHAGLRDGENSAPDFDAVWSAATLRHRRERTRSTIVRVGIFAAVIACAILATSAFRPGKKPSAPAPADLPWRSAVLLTEWSAPTDAVLPVPELFPRHN